MPNIGDFEELRNYYVICDDNCKFPSMTYEQIIEAIAEATGNVPEHVEDAFITKVKESNNNANLTFWKGTQAEFNALDVSAPVFKVGIDANGKLYFTPFTADDLTAHASRHASGGEDELTAADIGALPDYGGVMGGNIDMDGNKVIDLAEPTASGDAATKKYVDDKSDIVFFCGDGNTDEITTHAAHYKYLDTGETLNIDLSKYMLEVNIHGFGKVGAGNSIVLDFTFIFSDGTASANNNIKNGVEITEIEQVEWNSVKKEWFFGEDYSGIRTLQWFGTSESSQSIAAKADILSTKTLKRLYVEGVNANNALQNCVIKFVRVKDRG